MHNVAHLFGSALSHSGDAGVAGAGAAGGALIGIFLFIALLAVIIVALILVSTWMVYKKAGRPGWASIIPFYRTAVLLEIVKKPLWWIILLSFVPVVNIILAIILLRRLAQSFGKGRWFTVGLFFLPFIFFPILAFGSSVYNPATYGEPAPMSEAVKWALIAAVIFAISESLVISSFISGLATAAHPDSHFGSDSAYSSDYGTTTDSGNSGYTDTPDTTGATPSDIMAPGRY
ncbi:MAG: hypothetical protein JWL75_80 [Parcubacteria group bacterium]|nr:hypothetical protein [Parcubacteria group bacterium]